MASASSTQQSFRKALGALKDSTQVGLAKVNSDYKELDIAIVKATNHDERMPKEKHVRTIFYATSAARPRADVAHCIQAIAKRLAKTHNWAVAVKTLMIIHRALREVDPTFREELINYTRNRGYMLNLSHFRDVSSPIAWDYSAWARTYALYLEERLECFRILNYDAGTERSRTRELSTVDLLEQLPALQQLLFRLLDCQPGSAAVYNNLIQCALSIIAGESVRIYSAINDGTLNLVDKFFEMKKHDAIRALEIYRKASHQAGRLSEFYEICNGLDLLRRQKFIKIEQPPASFITAMEEYVKEDPLPPSVHRNLGNDNKGAIPKVVMAIEQKKSADIGENLKASDVSPEPPKNEVSVAQEAAPSMDDLLGLNEFGEESSELDQKNALALAIATTKSPSNVANGLDLTSGASGWELALVSAPSSNGSDVTESKLAGGLDRLTLDSLYDNAMARPTNQSGSYHMGQVAPNPFESVQYPQDPFFLPNNIAPPANVQMAAMAQQQAFVMQQQQQQQRQPQLQLMGSTNPFANPYEGVGIPSTYPSHNPNASLI